MYSLLRVFTQLLQFTSPSALSPIPSVGTPQTTSALVDLGYASYQGTPLSVGVNQYLGIPFAAPPIGDLRWRAPADPEPVSGVQSANDFSPICLGIKSPFLSTTESEDCLYLNVWAPKHAKPGSKLPVWLFIQGGGYVTNSNPNYNGSNVVDKSSGNIVFVNFNYRVSAYGFLASEKIRKDGDLNVGLLDQRKAMKWVKKYISLFGGDPEAVVIHGSSAGAGSVALHLTAYGGRDDNLFSGAIGDSVFCPRQPKVDELESQFDRFAEDAGCADSSDPLNCLRALDTAVLQAQNRPSPYIGAVGNPKFYFTPTVDGDLIEDYSYVMFERGAFINVPILLGNDNDEGTIFGDNASTPADVATSMHNNYPHLLQTDLDAINKVYPLMEPFPNRAAYFPSAAAAYGEATFTCPSITFLQSFVQYFDPHKVWYYRFNMQDEAYIGLGYGVPHTFEIPAIFGLEFVGTTYTAPSYTTDNKAILPIVQDYFISFVRNLSPNRYKNEAAPHWEAYTHKQKRLLLQTNATAMEVVLTEQLARCEFWKGLGVTMEI